MFLLPSNFLVQFALSLVNLSVSTIGDDRVPGSTTWFDGNLSALRTLYNTFVEGLYAVILVVEGTKLRKTIKSAGGDDNPAAKKVMKYIKTCVPCMVLIVLFRLSTQVLPRVGKTLPSAKPLCSSGAAMIDPVSVMTIITFACFMFVFAPARAAKKVAPSGAASTQVSAMSKTSERSQRGSSVE